jgi:hypothetical protein
VGLNPLHHLVVIGIGGDVLGIDNPRLVAKLASQKIEATAFRAVRHVGTKMRPKLFQFPRTRVRYRGSSRWRLCSCCPVLIKHAGLDGARDVAVLYEISLFIEVLGGRLRAHHDWGGGGHVERTCAGVPVGDHACISEKPGKQKGRPKPPFVTTRCVWLSRNNTYRTRPDAASSRNASLRSSSARYSCR